MHTGLRSALAFCTAKFQQANRAQRPFGVPHHPFGVPHEPFGVPHYPFGVPHQPFGVPHHPSGAPHHPFGAPHHPFGVPHHLFGVPHPLGVPHPFGAPHLLAVPHLFSVPCVPLAPGTIQLLSSHGGISTEEAEAPNAKGVLPASRGASGPCIATQGFGSRRRAALCCAELRSRAGDAGKETPPRCWSRLYVEAARVLISRERIFLSRYQSHPSGARSREAGGGIFVKKKR